jgi:virulence factor Mce-like protein
MRHVPLGRLAIAVQAFAALVFVGYTLAKKDIYIPLLSSKPYEVDVVFPDAKGLDPSDEPPAAVAGSPKGRVKAVRYEHGRAIVTLRLEPEMRGKIFADASAAIRPASALQNLLVNVDPGTPEAGPLGEDDAIDPDHTSAFVAIDEFTGVLDADTQAYLRVLLAGLDEGLDGRETELREAIKQLAGVAETAAPISAALAERRRLVTRLVGHLDTVFSTLGDRGVDLALALDAGNRTLRATTARQAELADTVRELGPTLATADSTLAAVDDLARPLVPALDAIEPMLEPFARSTVRLRRSLPSASSLLDDLDGLARDGREPLGLMREGTRGLRGRLGDQRPVVAKLLALTKLLDENKVGIAQTSDLLSGAYSVQDNRGVVAQVAALKAEAPKPVNFGGSPARRSLNRTERRRLALALERTCRRQNPIACVARFNIPGLSKEPVIR